jgi:hypothetical protein
MTTITVTIGKDTRTFALYQTNAPKAYDHGQAIELYDGTHMDRSTATREGRAPREVIERYVLIPEDAVEWQRGRNGSGLRTFDTDDTILDADELARYLWARLYGERS